ncbi:MAG TPA: hypothetical protein VFW47_10985 [Phenylobacterium sp.]|nr:hypothetical protein [Phenylobacterium sp.]
MIKLVPFKLVFRSEPIWINPEHVRSVHRRAGVTAQTCIRLAGLPDNQELVVEGGADEVIRKLTGDVPAKAVRPMRTVALNSEAVKALVGQEPIGPG